jgi:AmmeMemoRadiSam system protein A
MLSPSKEERKAILELARQGVVAAVSHGRLLPSFPGDGIFAQSRGLFVTLHVGTKLRGCIGLLDPHTGLGESLVQCAADAALRDPRFPAMRPEELGELEVEVSLLSPLRPIRPNEVEIGRHGLMVELGGRRGLLLPQVAVENRLTREQFLGETCVKAGLPREAWNNSDAHLYGFECEIIAEAPNALE